MLLRLSAGAIATSELIGLNQVWEDGVVYTVVVFAAILTTLRPGWELKSFWKSLALIFTGHTSFCSRYSTSCHPGDLEYLSSC
jgi:hypothetical protein